MTGYVKAMTVAAALVMTAPTWACAQDGANADGAGWTARSLDLDLYPDFVARKLRVHGHVRLRLDQDRSSGPTLRLGHDLTPYTADTEIMRFTHVAAAGATATLNRPDGKPGMVLADLRFGRAKVRGATIDVEFDAESIHRSFEFVVTDKVAMGADGTGWYARPVPAPGQPWSASIDPTPGVTRIHMPKGWSSLATGAFVSKQVQKGEVIETWRQDIRRARSFAIGPYKVSRRKIGKMNVAVYALTPAMDPDALSDNVAKIMKTLSSRYGPYPYSKYGAAEFPDDAVNWWGDALADFQILRTSLVKASNGGFVPLAHEIGHAWWGNTVTPTYPGGYMLSEALAGYSSLLALEGVYGPERYKQALYISQPGTPPDFTIQNHFKFISENKDVALSRLTHEGPNDYQISLVKGTFFYHMLRRQVGDQVFFRTLKTLVAEHAGQTLSLDQLRAAFIAAAPDKNLPRFFEQWLDRTGAPVFHAQLNCSKTADGFALTRVELDQAQTGAPYVFAMTVLLKGTTERRESVAVTDKTTIAEIAGLECYSSIELDPDHDLFIWRPGYAQAPPG